ncbi:MAG: hypothetical protein QXS52_01885, partial [Thermoplasmata archaeon]
MILLPFLLLLPLIFSIIPLFSGKNAKFVSSILSFIMVIFAVIFYFYINTIFTTSQFLGIDLSLSVTYLSYPLILLVSIIVFIAIVYQEKTIEPSYFSYILFLEFSLFGVFLTQNIFIFYIFWELVLIPSYFMIGKWGE